MASPKAQEMARARDIAMQARVAGLELPAGGAWARVARAGAEARLREVGLPGRRDEYWRYTDPALLTAAEVSGIGRPWDERQGFSGTERLTLVFVNGVFDAAASDDPAMAGVEIEQLGAAAASDIHWARELYGVLETRGQSPVPRSLATLNTAFAQQGMVIRATGRAEQPVALVHRSTGGPGDALLHHIIRLEPGADLTVLESGAVATRANTVMEVDVADKARFHHIRLQPGDDSRSTVTHVFARLGSDSLFKSFTLSADGALTRNEMVIELAGDDARAHVAGAALGAAGFHHDDTVFVTHAGLRCESRQVFKKVLHKGATGVFQGKILVRQGAQKTDGYQISQALLLDDEAQFLAKPELEIYADDVKCSHGSTSGAIDETALFYLRSRGVPKDQAQALLVLSFLADAVAEIEDAAIAEAVVARLQDWLAGQQH